MTRINDILTNVKPVKIHGDADIAINGLCLNSRAVVKGNAFVAVRGTAVDGHHYINAAIANGAVAIICDTMPATFAEGVVYLQLPDTSVALGWMADAFYNHPTAGMKVVGVTGTNGKTTVVTLLYKLFESMGYKCGLVSTVQNHIHDTVVPATHTTPDAISLQALFRQMADAGCTHVFMEVSSHAIHQHRIAGIQFAGGLFTNITHDHLDYHKTFDEYIRVKKLFFDNLPQSAFALTNTDDKRGIVMVQNTKSGEVCTYSLRIPANFKGKVLENSLTGLVMLVNGVETHFRLIGIFNAYNLLAVYGAAVLLGADKLEALAMLSELTGARGRFETYLSPKDKVLGIVDYAHTPDALINVLATINQLRTDGQRLITIIGCGGDRDTTKRPLMAAAACEHSNQVILTADNPRSEDPEAILNDMEEGLTITQKRKKLRITDRREAIKTAVALANAGDIVLVAGKGHEDYQEIKGVKHHFDDKEVLIEAFVQLER